MGPQTRLTQNGRVERLLSIAFSLFLVPFSNTSSSSSFSPAPPTQPCVLFCVLPRPRTFSLNRPNDQPFPRPLHIVARLLALNTYSLSVLSRPMTGTHQCIYTHQTISTSPIPGSTCLRAPVVESPMENAVIAATIHPPDGGVRQPTIRRASPSLSRPKPKLHHPAAAGATT